MSQRDFIKMSQAGEHLVCADLLKRGWTAYIVSAGLRYDVLVDIPQVTCLRVQVKTALKMRRGPQRKNKSYFYTFQLRRWQNGKRVDYQMGEADIFAFVCLEDNKVGYMKFNELPHGMLSLRSRSCHYNNEGRARYIEDLSFDRVLQQILAIR